VAPQGVTGAKLVLSAIAAMTSIRLANPVQSP
jgi:hypothetical protein